MTNQMDEIAKNYDLKRRTSCDINEHLPTLKELARECTSIAELGVRSIVSTWAFLAGLLENGHGWGQLVCVDIDDVPAIRRVIDVAAEVNISMMFIRADSAKVNLPDDVDLLFIDTWHVYEHLRRELARHASRARKYIVLHDTEVDRVQGESVRRGLPITEQAREYGYPEEGIRKGLQCAVDEFIASNSDWIVWRHFSHNNGLTVLKRV
jgi:hypothetical protein